MHNVGVLFDPGLHGTFLAWLIDQHDGFTKTNELERRYENGKITDYATLLVCNTLVKPQNHEWHTDESITLNAYMKFGRRVKFFDDPDAERTALKFFPGHSYAVYTKTEIQLLKEQYELSHILIPYVGDTMHAEIEQRFQTIRPNRNLEDINRSYEIVYEQSEHVREVFPKSVHYVDIGKLLTCDEEEYMNMCAVLEMQPHKLWNTLVNIPLKDIDVYKQEK